MKIQQKGRKEDLLKGKKGRSNTKRERKKGRKEDLVERKKGRFSRQEERKVQQKGKSSRQEEKEVQKKGRNDRKEERKKGRPSRKKERKIQQKGKKEHLVERKKERFHNDIIWYNYLTKKQTWDKFLENEHLKVYGLMILTKPGMLIFHTAQFFRIRIINCIMH